MLKRILLLGLVAAATAVILPNVIWASEDAMVTAVTDALEVSWVEVNTVEITEAEDDTILTVYYTTREMDELAYRTEMLEIFRLVGTVGERANMDIAIIPQIKMGERIEGLEVASISLRMAQRLAAGDMTRTDFLDNMQTAPLEHFRHQEQNPA